MNYAKICKILPMCGSPNDNEALTALRLLQKALAPETFVDIARMIEAAMLAPEPAIEAPKREPFNGFKPAARTKPPQPAGTGWVWDEMNWAWRRVKPAKPIGDSRWNEQAWAWQPFVKPPRPEGAFVWRDWSSTWEPVAKPFHHIRFQRCVWSAAQERWNVTTNFDAIMSVCMELLAKKLPSAQKKFVEDVFASAMAQDELNSSALVKLEHIERQANLLQNQPKEQRYQRRYGINV